MNISLCSKINGVKKQKWNYFEMNVVKFQDAGI